MDGKQMGNWETEVEVKIFRDYSLTKSDIFIIDLGNISPGIF